MRLMVFGTLAMALSGIAVGWTRNSNVADVIQAQAFECINGEGKVTARMSSSIIQGGRIDLWDVDGKNKYVTIMASEDNGMITILNGDGKLVATMSSDSEGRGKVSVASSESWKGAVIGVDDEGGFFSAFASNGLRNALVGIGEDGGMLTVANAEMKEVAMLAATKNGGMVTVSNWLPFPIMKTTWPHHWE